MEKVIGIDLGTTNSCVAIMEGGEPTIIPNAEGGRTTPSVVGFSKTGELLVGQVAKRQAIVNPDSTVMSIKRHMGSNHREKIGDKEYTPQQISAFILQKLKTDAEAYLGEQVTKAVITVPAYFDDAQRQATKDAGRIAGLDVLRIINEPTAAALAYGMDKEETRTILVFDLGGGTFDVSILEIGEGVFEVKATSGNNRLGGDDFDQRIIDHLVAEFKKDSGINLSADRMALQRLREAAEKAKTELSGVTTTNISLPFITADASGPKHFELTLTRAKFEELTADLVEKTMGPARQALKDSGLSSGEIGRVLLVGGATRMPCIQEAVRRLFGKDPHKGINPDECVAAGAAIQAGVLAGEVRDIVLLDVTPLSLGIETLGGVFTRMIERNTTIPTRKTNTFTTAADNQPSVDVNVLQGERPMAAGNKSLGHFRLEGIPPAPRGVPQVEVTFDIDVNGIVNVSAKDLGTGKAQSITITGSTRLSEEDVQKMVNDAERHAAEDKKRKEEVDTKNEAESMVFQAEKVIKDFGDKADKAQIEKVEQAVVELKEALSGDDATVIKAKLEALIEPLHALSAEMYRQAASAAGPASEEPQDEKTMDADYEVK